MLFEKQTLNSASVHMVSFALKHWFAFPSPLLQLQKKKWWEAVQPSLYVDHRGRVKCKTYTLQTRAGVVYAPTLKNVSVS